MTPRRKTKPIGVPNTKDVRVLADAAMADVASVSTTLALLVEAERTVHIEADDRHQLQIGVRSKCLTAIIALQAIDAALGGAR